MGVDSSEKGVADVLEDQRGKGFKDKAVLRKAGTSGTLQRTGSGPQLVGEDEQDVMPSVRGPVGVKDGSGLNKLKAGGNVRLNFQSGSVLTGAPGAFSFNATHLIRGPDSDALDCESNYDTGSVASLELKSRGMHRSALLGPLSKPTPSKWDDAEPWLVNLSAADTPSRPKAKSGPLQGHLIVGQHPAPVQKRPTFGSHVGRQGGAGVGQKLAPLSSASHSVTSASSDAQSSGDDLTTTGEDSGQSSDQPPRPSFERTKKVDTRYSSSQGDGGAKFSFVPVAAGSIAAENKTVDRYPLNDVPGGGHVSKAQQASLSSDDSSKPTLRTEKPTSDNVLEVDVQAENCGYDSSTVTVRSVCMRDMGTEMTPIASKTATPLAASTPTLGSPSSSRPTTPKRHAARSTTGAQGSLAGQAIAETETKVNDLSDKQVKTRQEILALGAQLGKANVAAWATKESEENQGTKTMTLHSLEEVKKDILESRAAVWEEAERSKYLARYTREEARILAWENHQKAKAEAELRRIEVKIERVRSHANEKLMYKLAAARRQAQDMRASAEARRAEQAARTHERADRIRRTGKFPGTIFCGLCS